MADSVKSSNIINGWTIVATLLVVVIIAGSAIIGLNCRGGQAIEITLTPEREITGTIYIGGAVNNPGYYPVFAGDTLDDLIGAAGGLKTGASFDDVELVISKAEVNETQKIDINRAEAWLLEALPGVGETKAQAIIDYREQNGFFRDINEIMNVPGFGEGSFNEIKDLITVND
jgi:competence protein ComEA